MSRRTGRPMGRPPFNPTERERRLVQAAVGAGLTQPEICAALEIGETTLRKHLASEIACGRARLKVAIADTLFVLATSGKCPSATIFCAKMMLPQLREPADDPLQALLDGMATGKLIDIAKTMGFGERGSGE